MAVFDNKDPFSAVGKTITAPAESAFAITPDDANDMPRVTRAIYTGVGGNIAVEVRDGNTVTFQNVQAGTVLEIRCRKVLATGTTAGSLIGLY